MIGQFNRFDESIGCMAGCAEGRRNVLESLVVEAVDVDDRFAKDLRSLSPLVNLDFMHQDPPHIAGVGMIERVGKLVRDMSVEGTPKSHVHHLAAATNAKERLAV
jgi:hypothetical protein